MKTVLYTLYEGDYHFGVAALLNSALAVGFDGDFCIGYRGELPPWVRQLNRVSEDCYELNSSSIRFMSCETPRHLGYYKAQLGIEVFDQDSSVDAVVYADPDVLLLAPWEFFREWLAVGVALVQDINFPTVSQSHPWRLAWTAIAENAGVETTRACERYPNSGFIGVTRGHCSLLGCWEKLIQAYENSGGDVSRFNMAERWRAITGDQDLLAAALQCFDGRVSWSGPEAMGFTGYYFILSHAIESPKPWGKSFATQALRGNKPTEAARLWLKHSKSPINLSRLIGFFGSKYDFYLGKLISRVWRR